MTTFVITWILALTVNGAAAGTPSAQAAFKLGAVDVVGAERYTSSDLMKVAGLSTGQPITVESLTRAADRLGQSGLLSSLSFRYVTSGDVISVTFEVEESEPTVPVTFDNLVWFTDSEVRTAVRDAVPAFDGVVPAGEGVPDLIVAALQGMLKGRAIPGRIHFSPQADLTGDVLGYVFSVRDPAPTMCALRIDGAAAIPEAQLVQDIPVAGNDVSASSLTRWPGAHCATGTGSAATGRPLSRRPPQRSTPAAAAA